VFIIILKIFVIVKDIQEKHMLKSIQRKKRPLLKPDLRIRTHAQSDFIRSKNKPVVLSLAPAALV